ncbi:hypothetical protein GIV75_30945 [Pseudomonas sp. PA-3-5D]|uniref:hypothetical protein n=1 Tax=Pseudomonas sp. PA-3-5D TaxID=2665473 RepID=UPI001F35E3F0|nr:hypothetical protein [Pseudomonas sp. PA-3-5D]MCF5565219.1 hypothetical protein [Pseudomonas sp. PA-3-5D]
MDLKQHENIADYLYEMGYVLHRTYTNNMHKFIAVDEIGNQVKVETPDYTTSLDAIKFGVTLVELNKPSLSPEKLLTVGLGNNSAMKNVIGEKLGDKGQFIMARVDSVMKEHLLAKTESLNPESPNPNEAKKGCTIIGFVKGYYELHGNQKNVTDIDEFLAGKKGFKTLSTEILDLYIAGVEQYMDVLRKEKTQYLVKDMKPTLRLVK